MPPLRAIKRLELIRLFKELGFEGPFSGGKHQYMVKENLKVWIPNPHQRDISPALLVQILRQAEISREEWEELLECLRLTGILVSWVFALRLPHILSK